jgi:hypothetical protein
LFVFQITGNDDYGAGASGNTYGSGNNSCASHRTDSDNHSFSCANVIEADGNRHTDSFAKAHDNSFTDPVTNVTKGV